MTGLILDAVLMLLLVAALGYGVRLERKLSALRAGQEAFAGAVSELNVAAGRAEAALASLRTSNQETDLLHDRIVKARELKTQLEALIARAPVMAAAMAAAVPAEPERLVVPTFESSRAQGLADTLAARIAARAEARTERAPERPAEPARTTPPSALVQALAASQAAQRSLNQARRTMDEDLFAA